MSRCQIFACPKNTREQTISGTFCTLICSCKRFRSRVSEFALSFPLTIRSRVENKSAGFSRPQDQEQYPKNALLITAVLRFCFEILRSFPSYLSSHHSSPILLWSPFKILMQQKFFRSSANIL